VPHGLEDLERERRIDDRKEAYSPAADQVSCTSAWSGNVVNKSYALDLALGYPA
jgi:hypothetical protein